MPPIPLFTRPELEASFALILPPGLAAETASEWWDLFADEVDDRGFFLYDVGQHSPILSSTAPVASGGRERTPAETEAQERLLWSGLTIKDRRELLLRFSSFHFRLLALVSDELFERMRVAEGLSLPAAERGRAQMKRIVAAIQAG